MRTMAHRGAADRADGEMRAGPTARPGPEQAVRRLERGPAGAGASVREAGSGPAGLAWRMLDAAPVCLLAVEAKTGRVALANRRARALVAAIAGTEAVEVEGRPMAELLPWPAGDDLGARLRATAETGESRRGPDLERVRLAESGEETAWSCELAPLDAERADGGTRLVLVTLADVTRERCERARQAQAVFAAELRAERLEAILDHAGDAVVVRDSGGQVVAYNRAALDFATNRAMVEHARARGRRVEPIWTLTHADGTPVQELEEPSWRAMLTGAPVASSQLSLVREGGALTAILVQATPLRDEAGEITGAVTAFQDITAMKELERQKDEFLSVASHELRQPLTVIQGQAQMLKRHLRRMGAATADGRVAQSGEALKNLADGVESQTLRLNLLVSDLLDMSRIQAGQLRLDPERGALLPLVRRLVELQRQATLDHELTLVEELPPGVPDLEGVWDLRRIEQILMNLLSNAVKYSPEGGEVRVEVGVLPAGEARGHGGRSRRGRVGRSDALLAHVVIRDRGIGIPPDALRHLFERFYRASNTAGIQGTGLGLFICRQLARAHGGDLWAESGGIGEGSAFHLTLPLAEGDVGEE